MNIVNKEPSVFKLLPASVAVTIFVSLAAVAQTESSNRQIKEVTIVGYSKDVGSSAIIKPAYCQNSSNSSGFYCTAVILKDVVVVDKDGNKSNLDKVLIFERTQNGDELLALYLSTGSLADGILKVEMGSLKFIPADLALITTQEFGQGYVGQFKIKIDIERNGKPETLEVDLGTHIKLDEFKQ